MTVQARLRLNIKLITGGADKGCFDLIEMRATMKTSKDTVSIKFIPVGQVCQCDISLGTRELGGSEVGLEVVYHSDPTVKFHV